MDRDHEDRWTKPFWVFKVNPQSPTRFSYWCVQWGPWYGAWRKFDTFEQAIYFAASLRLRDDGTVWRPY